MTNPATDGLTEIANYGTPDGDEVLIIRGVESATSAIRHGRAISPHAYNAYRRLIARVKALEEALDDRVKIQCADTVKRLNEKGDDDVC